MIKNPWFTLILGLLAGIVIGYVLAEQQQVPQAPPPAQEAQGALPSGHPPVAVQRQDANTEALLAQQIAELEARVASNPSDPRPMIMLGNLRFDAEHWQASRMWYERALEIDSGNTDVIVDLAVVYRNLAHRNLAQYEKAMELLEQAIAIDPKHPVAWFNKVIIYTFDLKDPKAALAALEHLKQMPQDGQHRVDVAELERRVMESIKEMQSAESASGE
jgi:cytochrome c-type biogenesis protein CcmH/NrfG